MHKKKEAEKLSEDDLLVYGAYVRVAYSLQHSNLAQLSYKSIALTWIIATYVGIGYSPSSFEVNLPLNPLLLVAIICLASLLVLGAIWYRDLIVEEKKIAAAVHKGIALEEKYPFLPQVYHNVVKMNYLLGYVSMKSMFYMAFAIILLLTICATVAAYSYLQGFTYWWGVPFLILIAIPILFFLSNWMTKKTDPYPVLEKLNQKGKNGNR